MLGLGFGQLCGFSSGYLVLASTNFRESQVSEAQRQHMLIVHR